MESMEDPYLNGYSDGYRVGWNSALSMAEMNGLDEMESI